LLTFFDFLRSSILLIISCAFNGCYAFLSTLPTKSLISARLCMYKFIYLFIYMYVYTSSFATKTEGVRVDFPLSRVKVAPDCTASLSSHFLTPWSFQSLRLFPLLWINVKSREHTDFKVHRFKYAYSHIMWTDNENLLRLAGFSALLKKRNWKRAIFWSSHCWYYSVVWLAFGQLIRRRRFSVVGIEFFIETNDCGLLRV
jgi:hypothetical protein